jgi:hypothetical protein
MGAPSFSPAFGERVGAANPQPEGRHNRSPARECWVSMLLNPRVPSGTAPLRQQHQNPCAVLPDSSHLSIQFHPFPNYQLTLRIVYLSDRIALSFLSGRCSLALAELRLLLSHCKLTVLRVEQQRNGRIVTSGTRLATHQCERKDPQ